MAAKQRRKAFWVAGPQDRKMAVAPPKSRRDRLKGKGVKLKKAA